MSTDKATPPAAAGPTVPGRAGASTGPLYWRSLEELAEDPRFLDGLRREFPNDASRFEDPRGRREFMGLMGASLALAGLTACTKQPTERIVPYVRPPADLVLGRPLFFATSLTMDGFGRGVLVESHENRPTKVEGNPDHPESLGGTDVFAQAEILSLYDPDRLKTVRHLGEEETLANFAAAARAALETQRPRRGAGLRVLTGTTTSPTLARQFEELQAEFPEAKVVSFEPVNRDNTRAGAVLAFGEAVEPQYHLAVADVVLAIDADFVGASPSAPRLIREFTSRRRVEAGADGLNRLYAVETTPTLTGGVADHRLAVPPSEVAGLLRALAQALGVAVEAGPTPHEKWAQVVARDLKAQGPASLVMVGEPQPPEVHALAHVVNKTLGAAGHTVTYTPPAEFQPGGQVEALSSLVAEMKTGKVDTLLVLGGNPAFDAPADLAFADAMERVPLRIHLTLDENETSERCHWQIPAAHTLEAWGDVRSADGTLSIVQPLIAPLYGGKSAHEILALLSRRPGRTGYDLVRERWAAWLPASDFEARWRRVLHDGLLAGSASPLEAVTARLGEWAKASRGPAITTGYEVVFRPDPTVWDGRYANNGWLQELPKPLTKLTWDNTALVSPRTARALGIETVHTARGHYTDVVSVRLGDRSLSLPAWVLPGQPDGVVTLHLGYGRTRVGRVGRGAGVNAYPLRASEGLWSARGLELRKSGEQARLACTQDHWSIDQPEQTAAEARHLVRSATLGEFRADPEVFKKMGADPKKGLSLYPERPSEGHAWGLSIDLNSCVGCNACVVACQSENNIAVVGKDQVARGREMHWIRLDRYYRGPAEEPDAVFHQPVMCMHCENAPCEVVCPVAATVHSPEGLNEMVYNRCVGTRYCSNNCPYKVRRFNFLLYQDFETESLKLMRNPDVTVRSRGVMEKCTYCVQRIERARIDARNEGRDIKDGEIRTACEQACPAQAIVFGDVRDEKSRVALRKAGERDYGLLTELQTRPRTTYLASVRNPNPELQNG